MYLQRNRYVKIILGILVVGIASFFLVRRHRVLPPTIYKSSANSQQEKFETKTDIVSMRGENGVAGKTGARGSIGTQGAQGEIGATGATGAKGERGYGGGGSPGATGSTGAIGANGSIGETGMTGAVGNAGAPGSAGSNGVNGDTGPQGNIGVTGLTGNTGSQGLVGATGPTGPAGSSATVVSAQYVRFGSQPATIGAGQPFTYSTTILSTPGITTTTGIFNPPFTVSGTIFTLAEAGRYEINYQMNYPTDGGVLLYFGSTIPGMVPLAYTMIGKTPDSSIDGNVIVQVTSPNSFLSVNAAAGNAAAIAIPPNTSTTNQSATTISFKRISD